MTAQRATPRRMIRTGDSARAGKRPGGQEEPSSTLGVPSWTMRVSACREQVHWIVRRTVQSVRAKRGDTESGETPGHTCLPAYRLRRAHFRLPAHRDLVHFDDSERGRGGFMGAARTSRTLPLRRHLASGDRGNFRQAAEADPEREIHGSDRAAEPTKRPPAHDCLCWVGEFYRDRRPFHLELVLLILDSNHGQRISTPMSGCEGLGAAFLGASDFDSQGGPPTRQISVSPTLPRVRR